MKKIFLLFVATAGLSLTLNQSLSAQEEKVANKLYYTEFGGPGLIMSANFDGRFKSNSNLGLGFRLGAGFGIKKFDEEEHGEVRRTLYAFPVGLNYVFGKQNSRTSFEVGGGVSFLHREVALFNYDVKQEGNLIGFASFMFRTTPINGGFSFRVGFTPIIGTAGDMFPMGALGLGYAF